MSTPLSRSSLGLVAAGAVAILFLGAFSPSQPDGVPTLTPTPPANPIDGSAVEPASELDEPAPPGFPPRLAELVELARAHVDDKTILAFVQNSERTDPPTADQVLYLSRQGLSQTVIAALFKAKPQPMPEQSAPLIPQPAPAEQIAMLDVPPAGAINVADSDGVSDPVCALPSLEVTVIGRQNPAPVLPPLLVAPVYLNNHFRAQWAGRAPIVSRLSGITPNLPSLARLEVPISRVPTRLELPATPPVLPPLPLKPLITASLVQGNSKSCK